MPADTTVTIPESPLAPGRAPVRIRVREWGAGPPVVLLHGGWGHEMYPFDDAVNALAQRYRVIAPDRSGYGRSGEIPDLPADFHARATVETRAVLDALGVRRAAFWGHSDGAVIAVRLALDIPERVAGIIVEALHLTGDKPQSRAFFKRAADMPESFGPGVASTLAREHGPGWPRVVSLHARAWLRMADEHRDGGDLYAGRLGGVAVPTLIVHGAQDPRTEPGELDALRRALPGATTLVLPEGGHSPHSEPATAAEVSREVVRFLATVFREEETTA